jgi:hypothetical protein
MVADYITHNAPYKAEEVGGYASPADSVDSLDEIEVPVV